MSVEKIEDVIIAYAMNGEEIPVDHGFPLRVIVPGHYGMASVKWLTNIRVLFRALSRLLADFGLRLLGL